MVARYDRSISDDGTIVRIHQEDFCQALGIPAETKYEREGGPTITDCQTVIATYTAQPAVDQIKFLNIVIFNYLIGNADAHGKNFSLLYKQKKPSLAPAYDLISTAIYPELSKKMAMTIGGRYNPKAIYLRHFHRLVPDTKVAQSAMNRQIKTMIDKMINSAPNLKKRLIRDGLISNVFDEIITVIQDRATYIT